MSVTDRLLVGAAPWPLIVACANPRYARLYRRPAAVAAGYLALYLLALAAVAVAAPPLLVPWALVAVAASLLLLWRMRPDFGRSHGLPPGALHPVPVSPVTDRDFVTRRIAKHGPVSKARMPTVARPVVLVHGLSRGSAVLREHDDSLKWIGMSFDSLIPARFIRSMSPDDHRHYGRILRAAFADSVVEDCRPEFADIARAELDGLGARARDGEDVRPALRRYALTSLSRLFFGVQPGSDERIRIGRLYDDPGPLELFHWGIDLRTLGRALDEARGMLTDRAASIAAAEARGEHVPPSFLAALLRERPDALEDSTLAFNLAALLGTGYRDLAGLLHWIVKMLGDNAEWIDRVRADTAGDLATRVVLETLRFEQSEYVLRKVTDDIEIDGFVVPAGWYIRICVRESHRDPAVFADPELFFPDRFLGSRHTRDQYSPLGLPIRPCTGAETVVAVADAFVRELARAWRWEIVRDGPAEFDGFHWRPSRRLRIAMTPRVDVHEQQPDGSLAR